MTAPTPGPRPGSLWRSIAAALGVLIMTCSGLCSAAVGLTSLSEGADLNGVLTLLGAMAVYGGVPFALGYGLWRSGRARRDTST